MAINKTSLIRNWIQFLKKSRIVDQESDPATGNLRYRQKVRVSDVVFFLTNNTDLSEDDILNAIYMVFSASRPQQTKIGNQQGSTEELPRLSRAVGGLSTDVRQRPDPDLGPLRVSGPAAKKKKYQRPADATDVEWRDINEAFKGNDIMSLEMPEAAVEKLFDILVNRPEPATPDNKKEEPKFDPAEELNKAKKIIRDTLTPAQRRSLWRLLNDE